MDVHLDPFTFTQRSLRVERRPYGLHVLPREAVRPTSLELAVTLVKDTVIVTGALVVGTVGLIVGAIDFLGWQGRREIVVDLDGLQRADAVAIGHLVRESRLADGAARVIRLRAHSPAVRMMLAEWDLAPCA